MSLSNFSDFSFGPHLQDAVQKCGFVTPTPIQQQSMSPILAGRDLLGLAQTGTGKTAAFLLPIVERMLAEKSRKIRTLILAPTRELAEQIHVFAQDICKGSALRSMAVYGGVSKPGQVHKIRQGVDIVVACPGRLLDILADGAIDLRFIEHLVLDEADHMFDQGFLPDIRRILGHLPKKRQNLVFSATMPAAIRTLAEDVLDNPVNVQISRIKPADTVKHALYSVSQNQKTSLLVHLLGENSSTTTLVFTRTKHKAKNLAARLAKEGFRATSIQGNLTQNKRQQALDGFKNGTYNILVATDIAARGIDVSGISHVINFDAPDTAEAYIHRTGRTGRASCSGEAYTFATPDDGKIVRAIEMSLAQTMQRNRAPQLSTPDQQVAYERTEKGRGRKTGAATKKIYRTGKSTKGRSRSGNIFGLTT